MKIVRLLLGTVQSVFFLRGPAARTAWQRRACTGGGVLVATDD
jgi:hypothetical protein